MFKRRIFLKRASQAILGSLLSFVAAPTLFRATNTEVAALGTRQLNLLLAAKSFAEKAGMLRALGMFHIANDGQVEMDWSVNIPPEEQIGDDLNNLATAVRAAVGG